MHPFECTKNAMDGGSADKDEAALAAMVLVAGVLR
jgi:hypothetical protein